MIWDFGVGRSCCLNQDLRDFDGFLGWVFARDEGLDGLGFGGWPLLLSESGFAGF